MSTLTQSIVKKSGGQPTPAKRHGTIRDAIYFSEVLETSSCDKQEFRNFLKEWRDGNNTQVWLTNIENNMFLNAYLQDKLGFKVQVSESGIFTQRGGYQCETPNWAKTFILLCRSRGLRRQKKYRTIYLPTALYYLNYCV